MNKLNYAVAYIFFAPLMLILSVVERITGKRSPYWPFERGQE